MYIKEIQLNVYLFNQRTDTVNLQNFSIRLFLVKESSLKPQDKIFEDSDNFNTGAQLYLLEFEF